MESEIIFQVPTLPAYAAIDYSIRFEYLSPFSSELGEPRYEVNDDSVNVSNLGFTMSNTIKGLLVVHHVGIKDYTLLFPHIDNEPLKKRLGDFAQEAETAFENKAWMSYVLMVGAVLEGLLYAQFGNKKFAELIARAKDNNIIETSEADLFDEVRETRNRVHASKFEQPFTDRSTALELSVAYDRLLKRIWKP